MNPTIKFVRNAALSAALALAFSSSFAAVIATSPTLTPTTSVGFGQQSVAQGTAFEHLYVINATEAVGGIYSTVNWTPAATMATATFFKSDDLGVQSGSILGTFASTPGSNLALTYQGIVSGYYTVKVVGTAATGGANTLISGQASPIPIPVPGSLALLGLGMLGISLIRGRRSV